jgi:predicted nucleotide-binding protein
MLDISQHIRNWEEKLTLARDPTEAAYARSELERLYELRNKYESRYDGIPGKAEIDRMPVVLIIYGHDAAMKQAVQLCLAKWSVFGLVLAEQPALGMTLIEKLIEASNTADYAVALLSPDDLLDNGAFRARQNVILEIGYMLGKIGRSRVRLLRKGNTEIPSDLSGVLYDDFDGAGQWELRLYRELQAAGLKLK